MCRIRFILYCVAIPLLAVPAAGIDLRDAELFPPELFPELEELSESEVLLHGLNALFPERVFQGEPDDEPEETERRQALVKDIDPYVVYVRVYNLEAALPAIRENLVRPIMILDLRYVFGDLDSTIALGQILSHREQFHFHGVGDYPLPSDSGNRVPLNGEDARDDNHTLITLTNRETSGPLEVLLEQLRRDAEMISIGTASAGGTASFRRVPGYDDWWAISGELRPAPDVSLVDHGFIPRVEVDIEAEHDRAGYDRLDEEATIAEVVQTELREPGARRGLPSPPVPDNGESGPGEAPPLDLILQRAVNIVKALQALGRIPG